MLEAGRVVRSIAGHDKDSFYVIVEAAGNRAAIADGRARKLARPKVKNPLHLRPTSTVLDMAMITTDKKLRSALAAFQLEEEGG